jgi:hypothetical protein
VCVCKKLALDVVCFEELLFLDLTHILLIKHTIIQLMNNIQHVNYKNYSIVSVDMDKVGVMAAYCDRSVLWQRIVTDRCYGSIF